MPGTTITISGDSNDSKMVVGSVNVATLNTKVGALESKTATLETATLKGVFTMDSEFTNYDADYKLQYNFDIIDLPVNTTSGNIKLLPGTVGPTNDYFEYITYLPPTGNLETGGGKEINIPTRNLPLFKVTPEIRAQLDGVTFDYSVDNSVLGQWMEANGYSTTLSAEESYKQEYDYTNMPLWNAQDSFGNLQFSNPSLSTYLSPKMTLDRTKVVMLLDVSKNDLILYTGFFQRHTDFSGTPNANGSAQNYWEPHNAWVFYERIIKKQEYSTLLNSIWGLETNVAIIDDALIANYLGNKMFGPSNMDFAFKFSNTGKKMLWYRPLTGATKPSYKFGAASFFNNPLNAWIEAEYDFDSIVYKPAENILVLTVNEIIFNPETPTGETSPGYTRVSYKMAYDLNSDQLIAYLSDFKFKYTTAQWSDLSNQQGIYAVLAGYIALGYITQAQFDAYVALGNTVESNGLKHYQNNLMSDIYYYVSVNYPEVTNSEGIGGFYSRYSMNEVEQHLATRTTTLETSMNLVETRVTNLESKYPSGTYYFNSPADFAVCWTFSISGGHHVTELDVGSQNIHTGPIKYSITNEGLINTNFSDYYSDITTNWKKMAISRFVYNKSNNTVNYNDLDNNIYQGDATDYKIISESPNATLIKYMNYDVSNGVYTISSLGEQGDNYASNYWPNAMFQERKFLVSGAVNAHITLPSFNLVRKIRQLLVLDNSNGEYVVSHIHGNGPNDLYNEVGTGPSGERYTISEGPSTHHHSDKTNPITSSLNDISYSALIDSSNDGLIMNEDYPENMLLYLQDNSGEFNRNMYHYSDANRRVYNFSDFPGILTTFGITGVSGNILHDFVNEYLIFTESVGENKIKIKMFGRFSVPTINGRDIFSVLNGLGKIGLGVSEETRAQSSQNYPPTKKVSTTDISGFNANLWGDSFGNDSSANSYVNWRSWEVDMEDIQDLQNYPVRILNGPNPPTIGSADLRTWARSVL